MVNEVTITTRGDSRCVRGAKTRRERARDRLNNERIDTSTRRDANLRFARTLRHDIRSVSSTIFPYRLFIRSLTIRDVTRDSMNYSRLEYISPLPLNSQLHEGCSGNLFIELRVFMEGSITEGNVESRKYRFCLVSM